MLGSRQGTPEEDVREFNVQDRNRGIVLVHGTIDDECKPNAEEFDPSFDRSRLTAILEAIAADLTQGHSGGQLPVDGLEWFELSSG